MALGTAGRLVGDLVRDAAYGARRILRTPGFTAVGVVSLAIGIGLASLIFAQLNALFFRPLPGAADPTGLVALQAPVPYPFFETYRDETDVATSAAAFIGPTPFSVTLTESGPAGADLRAPGLGRVLLHARRDGPARTAADHDQRRRRRRTRRGRERSVLAHASGRGPRRGGSSDPSQRSGGHGGRRDASGLPGRLPDHARRPVRPPSLSDRAWRPSCPPGRWSTGPARDRPRGLPTRPRGHAAGGRGCPRRDDTEPPRRRAGGRARAPGAPGEPAVGGGPPARDRRAAQPDRGLQSRHPGDGPHAGLWQPGHPAPGTRLGAATRGGDPVVAGGRTRPAGAAAGDRGCGHRAARWRSRRARGAVAHPAHELPRPDRRGADRDVPVGRCRRARLHQPRVRAGRHRLRAPAGARHRAVRDRGDAQGDRRGTVASVSLVRAPEPAGGLPGRRRTDPAAGHRPGWWWAISAPPASTPASTRPTCICSRSTRLATVSPSATRPG